MLYQSTRAALVVAAALLSPCTSFSPPPSRVTSKLSSPAPQKSLDDDASQQHEATPTSRRNLLQTALVLSISGATASARPSPAAADVTNKLASTAALRSLTKLQGQLSAKLLPLAQSNDYVGAKQCLREPPLNSMRKDMLTLVRGAEDGPKAGELLSAYKGLVKSLEDLDTTASLGMRGGKNKPDAFQLGIEYETVEKALGFFVKVATEAVEIPMQYDTNQMQVGSIDVRSGKVEPRVI